MSNNIKDRFVLGNGLNSNHEILVHLDVPRFSCRVSRPNDAIDAIGLVVDCDHFIFSEFRFFNKPPSDNSKIVKLLNEAMDLF